MEAARPVEASENWIASGRLFDRALALIDPDDVPRRWSALLGRARAREAAGHDIRPGLAARAIHEALRPGLPESTP